MSKRKDSATAVLSLGPSGMSIDFDTLTPFADVTIEGLRTVNENNAHEHWRKRHDRSKAQKFAVNAALRTRVRKRPTFPVRVLLTRIAPRLLDVGDNDRASLKFVRDAVAAWLGVDDGPREKRVEWGYRPQEQATKRYAIRIEVFA